MAEKRRAPRQSVVTALVRPLMAAGCQIRGVRYNEDGSIEVLTGEALPEPATPFDAWKAAKDARSA